ncbi:MAG: biosynthetic peptidoglycan transglycosylase, partial [Bacteroidota bacterium]
KIGFDTSSFMGISKILFDFSFYYSRDSGKTVALKLDMPKTNSQNFFESLPGGMFKTVEGIKTKGDLSYHLDFKMNKENPDSLTFESELKKYDFRILKYGEEDISKINGSFLYTAYNDKGPVRTFLVGVENPFFTPLALISDKLKNAVLTSEDGAFYGHRGFNEDAFRQSIATNVKAGRFLRGGSTLSMQLVKNVFLSRNKTVSRKIEEALIVWLIENNYLVSKDRMFEVYLNIIEWGPDVYGINEAANFYYSKKPYDLDLAESIYLASIIPHPKYFKYSFDSLGNLKPFIAGYYRLIANHLLKKEKINQAEFDSLQPTVKLNGEALKYILPLDTVPADSADESIEY